MHVHITILLGLNQPTSLAANLSWCRGGSRNPTAIKMELFATIIAKCSILVMTGFMNLSLTTSNHDC